MLDDDTHTCHIIVYTNMPHGSVSVTFPWLMDLDPPGHHLGLCVAATAGGLSRMSYLERASARACRLLDLLDSVRSVRFCR